MPEYLTAHLSGGDAQRGRQGVLGTRTSTEEPKRRSQSAATAIVLANNKQRSVLADRSPPHLEGAVPQERVPAGNPSSRQAVPWPFCPARRIPARCWPRQRSTGLAKQDSSPQAVPPRPPQQPATKAGAPGSFPDGHRVQPEDGEGLGLPYIKRKMSNYPIYPTTTK